MRLNTILERTSIAVAMLLGATSAQAALSTSYTFNGKGGWSLDACGSNSTPVCTINAVVPNGSTIEAAFLYSSLIPITPIVPTVSLEGTTYSGADWTDLGANNVGLRAYRADVTAQITAAIGGGSASPFSFTVNSENPNNSIDGEVLAIIYSNPAETERTIAFLDGFSATTGDNTVINLADPLTNAQLTDPAFEATLSLGIGYGYQGDGQRSEVQVNGLMLTTCAGGQDDGGSYNGGLITVGGYGDNPANDHDCSTSGPRQDDELYSLTPFLSEGDTVINIDTINPSNDDNIFFAGINITARAGVNEPPPPPPNAVPEPSSIALVGLGLLGLGLRRIKKAA